MNFLRQVFFESLSLLILFELVVVAVIVGVHRQRHTHGSKRAIWIALAVCAALIVLQQMVVTDREALSNMVSSMAHAVDEGDVPAIAAVVDPSFKAGQVDRQQLIDTINQRLQQWQIDAPRVGILAIDLKGDEASVRFRVFCDLKSNNDSQPDVPSLWQIRCVRRPDGWKMVGIERAEMGPGVLTSQGGMDLRGYLNLR